MNKLKSLKQKADKLLQQVYTKLYPNCLVCGKETNCMHHFIKKSQSNYLRYDSRNLINLCLGCHFKLHQNDDPEIVETILRKKGMEWYNDLIKDRHNFQKTNITWLEQIINELEEL